MPHWFCAINDQQSGPHDDRQVREMIRAGRLGPADLAWRQGMSEWAPIGSIPELAAAASAPAFAPAAVPPLPAYASAPAPAPAPTGPWANQPAWPQAAAGQPYVGQSFANPAAAPGDMLNYATPAHLAPAPAGQLPVVIPDEGPFLRVGGSFSAKQRWGGSAVVSPRAFYLLKVNRQMNEYGGGVVGMLVSMAATGGDDDLRTCQLGQLPPTVQQQLDRTGRYLAHDVIVLPREAIRLVKVPAVNNAVYVHAGTERFTIFTVLFRNGRIRRFLGENGWIVNREVLPSAAPVHGQGFGRLPGGPAPKQMSTEMRILLAILAIIVFIAVVILRGFADSHRHGY